MKQTKEFGALAKQRTRKNEDTKRIYEDPFPGNKCDERKKGLRRRGDTKIEMQNIIIMKRLAICKRNINVQEMR
jgi:hypothetical protein